MSNSKKIISLLLSVIMILSVFTIVPFSAGAAEADIAETGAESGTTGDCTWTLDNGVLTISGNGKMEDYDSVWKNDAYVTTAPWGGCDFDAVIIENGVTNIGNYAFYGCKGLTSVTIPDSVTSIGDYAFSRCTNLISINIPDSVTSIGDEAFSYCTGLTSITIPDSVTSIGDYAFSRCTNLISINIPESVTSIGVGVFRGCTGLTDIKVAESNTVYDSRDNCNAIIITESNTLVIGCKNTEIPDSVTSIGNRAFYDCTVLTSVTIPDSVTSIGWEAFSGCTGLTSVTIPDSVTSIGSWVFDSCTSLTSVTIPDSVTSIGEHAFQYCAGLKNIDIPKSVTSIGDKAFLYCTGLTSVTIGDSVTSIGEDAFEDCTGLTSIKIAEGNTVYDSRNDCNAIIITESNELIYGCKNTVIPDSVTSIGSEAFDGCTELTSIDIPDSVTSIGYAAFRGCTGLTSVTIGNSVTSIGDNAFEECTGLTSVTIGNSVTSIDDFAFQYCTGLTSVTIPDSVTSIGYGAFRGCTGLTSIDIPYSVLFIGTEAFCNCTSFTSITIPNTVDFIHDYAFYGCTNLKSVTILGSAIDKYAFGYYETEGETKKVDGFTIYGYEDGHQIGDGFYTADGYAYYNGFNFVALAKPDFEYIIMKGCTAEIIEYNGAGGDVTIPSTLDGYTVTSIGDWAFKDCTGLTSVTIPDSVTSIGDSAFIGCTGLTSIKVAEGNTVYDSRDNCNALIETESNELIYGCMNTVIPDSVTSIGEEAFNGCTGLTSIDIPDSVTSIGRSAFSDCTGLTRVTIGNSVTSIGYSAFEDSKGLTSVTIPDSVTSIGNRSFGYYFDESKYATKKVDGFTIYGYEGSEAERYANDNGFTFIAPDEPEVNSGASGDCTWKIEDGVLTISGNGKMEDYDSVWQNDAYVTTAPWGGYAFDAVIIENGVTNIGNYAFYGCAGLTSVTIPDSVASIGKYAFYGCAGLTGIDIPDSVASIGNGAFWNCSGLTGIDIPDSLTSIEYSVFSGCTGLTSVTIPDSVTSIGEEAFKGCTSLTSATIGSSVTSIGKEAFSGCTELKNIDIPKSVTSIGDKAFKDCTALTGIDIPDSVTSIGDEAFKGCTNLTNVTIADSVTSIGENAFADTAWYNDLPDGLVYAGKVAYMMKGDCPAEVVIKDGTSVIGDNLFSGCAGLTSVTIPDTVTSIGRSAFVGCISLNSITIPASVASISDYAIGFVMGLTPHGSGYIPVPGFTIYGYEGSEAENYAEANEFTFIKLIEKKDNATGIILAVPEDTGLDIKDITADISSELPDGCNKMTAYDITLTKDGKAIQPESAVTVKIPCANENAKVYRLEADGKMTDMHAEYVDGYMVFTTDHFSVYVLAEPEPEVVAVPGDVTGDGKTNVQDCTAILRYVRKLDTLSDDQLKIGDVTGDGKVNVQDVTRILRHVRKIELLY